jgi:quercetin dioxygenase-like cupin family protein
MGSGTLAEGFARAHLLTSAPERFVPLRRQLGISSFGLNQIVLTAGQRGRIHRHHHQEEVYLVIKGLLTLCVEGDTHELGPGELMRVAPHVRRQLVNRGPSTVSVIAIGGAGEHEGRDGEAFTGWDEESGRSPQEVPNPPDLRPEELRR